MRTVTLHRWVKLCNKYQLFIIIIFSMTNNFKIYIKRKKYIYKHYQLKYQFKILLCTSFPYTKYICFISIYFSSESMYIPIILF